MTLSRFPAAAAAMAMLTLTAPAPAIAAAAPGHSAADVRESRFADDFDAFLSASMRRLPTIPALSVAVSRSRGPIFVRAYGQADRERHVAATPHTGFYIASSTKSFVGLVFARLAEERKIDLDWTLAELAPDIRFAPELRAREVTLRHLLSHSHGLSGEGIAFRLAYSGEHDPATLWRLLGRLKANPKAPLGTFAYSNLGYNIATLLIERRLHRRWQDLLADEVLRPMRLRETLAQGLARSPVALAQPYASLAPEGRTRLYLAKSDAILQSAGGIYSSAADMARWMALQLAAEKGARGLPVPGASVRLTHQPFVSLDSRFATFARKAYGFGWYSGPYQGATLYHSFGSFPGARAHTSFLPAQDVGVAIMSNDEDAGFLFVDIAAAYVYDWFADGPAAAGRNADQAIARLAEQAAHQIEARKAALAARAARPWRLSLPPAAYRGRFCNTDYGTLMLGGSGSALEAKMGLLRATAEPFTAPDSARVELVPGQGEVLQFATADSKVTAVRIMGAEFSRCG